MAKRALIGGVAAAGVVILGVGGVALATGDRESSVDTLTLTTSTPDGSSAAVARSVDASQDDAADDGAAQDVAAQDSNSGSSDAEGGSGSADTVPAGVTAEQAREIAVRAKPGTVDWLELTSDNGTTVWNVEVVTPERVEWDVYIDARSGEVLDVERD